MSHCKTGTRFSTFFFAVLFALALIAAPRASAQSSNAQPSTEKIKVIAHLELPGIHVKQIFLRNQGDHDYLYLLRPNKHAFAIVDVTSPGHPALVTRAAVSEPSGGNVDLPAQGSVLAISVVPDVPNSTTDAQVTLHTESVRLVDLSDPKHPQTLKTFEGVTSMASDDGRKLVYIVNSDGLWIVSHHHARPLPLCSSDADTAAMPDCQ